MQKSNGSSLKAKGFKRPAVEDEAYVKCSLCVVGECLQIKGRRRWNDLLAHSGTYRRSKQGTRNRALTTAFYKPKAPGMWTRSAPFTRQPRRPKPSFQAKPNLSFCLRQAFCKMRAFQRFYIHLWSSDRLQLSPSQWSTVLVRHFLKTALTYCESVWVRVYHCTM